MFMVFWNNYQVDEKIMKKLLLIIFSMLALTACTLRKEGGTWHVKKTIVDEVKETVQETKALASDLKDANNDLKNNNASQESAVQAEAKTVSGVDPAALSEKPSQDGIEPKKTVIRDESTPKKKRYKNAKKQK